MATLQYFSGATNRFPQAISASPSSGQICLASSRVLAFWNLDDGDTGVSETVPGHESPITCVKFLSENTVISGDEKGVWKDSFNVKAHSFTISAIGAYEDLVVTGSSDGLVHIWRYKEPSGELTQEQTIDLKGKYPLSIALSTLPDVQAHLLAIGGTDTKVHLWVSSEGNFVQSTALAGHEDWVKSLAFKRSTEKQDCLVLASGSQDSTIRLWNIEPLKRATADTEKQSDELLDAFEASLGDLGEGEEGGRQISLKQHILTVKAAQGQLLQYSITFDALLIGHEAGVTSIAWRDDIGSTPTLLSTSTDSSLILWSPASLSSSDSTASVWINRQRFGDVGGQRLGGFVGGIWARDGQEVIAWGWSGGSRRWRCINSAGQSTSNETWEEFSALTGHSGPVRGLDWSPDGEYLVSAGLDQTSRIHAPVGPRWWHEIARPQIHGYDVIDTAFIDKLSLASIADEKVLRVFEAPGRFLRIAEALGVANFPESNKARPLGANVPPLGLSNKATTEGTQQQLGPDIERRPLEGELAGVTLWPETEKIFGHGYESISLAVSHSKRFIATACKATSAKHAVIRIYDVSNNFKPYGEPLPGHELTITRIAFSPDDQYILSVSRDRTWRLFKAGASGFIPVAADKSHGRIIWDCSWSPDGKLFATASRDKTVKVWQEQQDKWVAISTIKVPQPVTAVAFAPTRGAKKYLAIGLESGEIHLYASSAEEMKEWKATDIIPSHLAHVDHIYRLAWRPTKDNSPPTELASCSEDGTLRILRVKKTLD